MTTHLPTLADIEAAAEVVYQSFQATPQYRWATLSARLGFDCWVKHENHTPVGAFKIRGGLTYFDQLHRRGELPREVMSATRGNHGQSIAWAARLHGVACSIVVPRGNSVEKNAAMRALGATLIEHGDDFQESREHAMALGHRAWRPHGAEFSHRPAARREHRLVGVLSRGATDGRGLCARWARAPGACSAIAAKLALGHPGAHRGCDQRTRHHLRRLAGRWPLAAWWPLR